MNSVQPSPSCLNKGFSERHLATRQRLAAPHRTLEIAPGSGIPESTIRVGISGLGT